MIFYVMASTHCFQLNAQCNECAQCNSGDMGDPFKTISNKVERYNYNQIPSNLRHQKNSTMQGNIRVPK